MSIYERVRLRVPDQAIAPDDLIDDYIQTITDRLNLRLGTETLPALFESIAVDASVKMIRRTYYEGIKTEGADTLSVSFVEDILSEYEQEIADWQSAHADDEDISMNRVVRFL